LATQNELKQKKKINLSSLTKQKIKKSKSKKQKTKSKKQKTKSKKQKAKTKNKT
jgi:hypothetical protein